MNLRFCVFVSLALGAFSSSACGTDDNVGPGITPIDGDTRPVGPDLIEPEDTTVSVDTAPPPDCVTTADCDGDLDVCRAWECVEGVCVVETAEDGSSCDDESVCSEGDSCLDGDCIGAPVDCDDGNACTDDTCLPEAGCTSTPIACTVLSDACLDNVCNPDSGACEAVNVPDGATCSNGVPCWVGEACSAGVCEGGQLAPQCDDANPCTEDGCTENGCSNVPMEDGAPCDDGTACTVADSCQAGGCTGPSIPCDDYDPCTADSCSGASCEFTPIDGCELPTSCDGKLAGTPCDDGNAATVGDFCSLNTCAGFTVTRVAPSEFGVDRLWLTEANNHLGIWHVAAGYEVPGGQGGFLSAYDPSLTALNEAPATRGVDLYTGLHAMFATRSDGRLLSIGPTGWAVGSPMDLALGTAGAGTLNGLWGYEDGAGQRLWVVGSNGGDASIKRCTTVVPAGTPNGAACITQSVPVQDADIRAVAGAQACTADGSCAVRLVAAGDDFDSTGADGQPRYFNDVYSAIGSVASSWWGLHLDNSKADRRSNAVVSLGGDRYVACGTNGYLSVIDSDVYTDASSTAPGQLEVDFEDAWSGADFVALVGSKPDPAGRKLTLWLGPRTADLTQSWVWSRIELGTEIGEMANLWGAYGQNDGTLMLVGGGATTPFGAEEGLIFTRQP